MHRISYYILLFMALSSAGTLTAQTTNTAASNTAAGSPAIESRYESANETWRLNTILFILKDQTTKYDETIKIMKDFTSVSRSYVIFKRTGHTEAEEIYFRNLENISRLEQLKLLLEGYKKDFVGYNKDFLGTYKMEERDFEDFTRLETVYQKTLDRWRAEFEAAMKTNSSTEIRRIRQDMQIFRVAINAFILFPGKSANKVSQLQTMENDIRHAVVMLRMYELSTKK